MKKLLALALVGSLALVQPVWADSPTDPVATAPATNASATQTSLLKKIMNLLNGTLATSDTTTQTNTATTAANTGTTATAAGAPADTAWVSGNGSIIAVLKNIATKLAGTLAATQSGTWTVQPGNTANTTPWLTTDSSDGPVTPGTVASKSSLNGCQYNTSAPAPTTGQQVSVQCDSAGNVKVVGGIVPGTSAASIFVAPIATESSGNINTAISCDNFTPFADATSGSKQLVALSASKIVYVCGVNAVASGTVAVKLLYGTGSNCATGATDITDAYDLTAQNGIVDHTALWSGLKTIASNALCVNLSASVKVAGGVYWTQF